MNRYDLISIAASFIGGAALMFFVYQMCTEPRALHGSELVCLPTYTQLADRS